MIGKSCISEEKATIILSWRTLDEKKRNIKHKHKKTHREKLLWFNDDDEEKRRRK